MRCVQCGEEFDARKNIASQMEIEKQKKFINHKIYRSDFIKLLGTAIPVYKCPTCGKLMGDIAEGIIATLIFTEGISTADRIDKARTELLLAREDMNAKKLFNLAGELSALIIVLDELNRLLLEGGLEGDDKK